MEAQVAYCLNCGYDLTGIPELRCPECGFGFTRQSTLWMARSFACVKLNVYRRVLLLSLGSCALSLSHLVISPWWTAAIAGFGVIPSGGFLSLVAAARVVGPVLQMYSILGVVGLVLLLVSPSEWPALVLVVIALVMLLSLPRAYPFFEKSVSPGLQRSLVTNRIAAYATLIPAVILLAVT